MVGEAVELDELQLAATLLNRNYSLGFLR